MTIKIFFKSGEHPREVIIPQSDIDDLGIYINTNEIIFKSYIFDTVKYVYNLAHQILYPAILLETDRIELIDTLTNLPVCTYFGNIIDIQHNILLNTDSKVEELVIKFKSNISLNFDFEKKSIQCNTDCKYFRSGFCYKFNQELLNNSKNEFFPCIDCISTINIDEFIKNKKTDYQQAIDMFLKEQPQ